MASIAHRIVVIIGVMVWLVACARPGSDLPLLVDAYVYDEYVPAAWRGQFRGVRTSWNDLTGRSVPRFRRETSAVLSIPLPEGFDAAGGGLDEYKVSYSIDTERHVTVWLPILEKRRPREVLPGIHIELLYRADEVVGVRGSVYERDIRSDSGRRTSEDDSVVSDAAKEARAGDDALMLQATRIHNATLWPKHVLVTYAWTRDAGAGATDVDIGFALTAVSAISLVAVVGIVCHVIFAPPIGSDSDVGDAGVGGVRRGGGRVSERHRRGASSSASPMDADAAEMRTLLADAARELGTGVAADMDQLAHHVGGRRRFTLDAADGDYDRDDHGGGSGGGGGKKYS